jgi:hypothetical protein
LDKIIEQASLASWIVLTFVFEKVSAYTDSSNIYIEFIR